MLSGPSSRRKKATSTTKVAPWSFCAGPKTSPGRLWAIMMWSRTSTAYMGRTSRAGIVDKRERRAGAAKDVRQRLRQHLEGRLRLQQDIEPGIGGECQREREAPPVVPAGAALRCDGADLGRAQGKAPAVKGAAEPDTDRARAVPAELHDLGLEAGERQ